MLRIIWYVQSELCSMFPGLIKKILICDEDVSSRSQRNRRFRKRRSDSILGTFYHDSMRAKMFKTFFTLCMKLRWFCHKNSGQLFCNCLLFVIVLVPALFSGGKPAETCCHSCCCFKMAENSASLLCRTKILQL